MSDEGLMTDNIEDCLNVVIKALKKPDLLPAADALDVSVVTTLLAYAYGDSTTNLVQPFFAIPILAVTRMRFGDVVGYTFLVAIGCFAVSAVAMLLIPARL